MSVGETFGTEVDTEAASLLRGALDRVATARGVGARTLRLSAPDNPGTVLVCRVPTDIDEMKRLQRGAKPKGRANAEADSFEFACILLAECCQAVEIEGIPVVDEDGVALTPRDRQLRDMVGAGSAREVIKLLVSSDGYILNMGLALQSEGGFSESDEVRESDPI